MNQAVKQLLRLMLFTDSPDIFIFFFFWLLQRVVCIVDVQWGVQFSIVDCRAAQAYTKWAYH